MNRRDFLRTCSGAAATLAAAPLLAAPTPAPEPLLRRVRIPDWARRELDAALTRYRRWRGDDLAVAFPYVTDLHSKRPTLPEGLDDFSDSKMHVLLAQQAADDADADFLADLGDIELDLSRVVSPPGQWPPTFQPGALADVRARLATHADLYRHWGRPVLFSLGNHDHANGRISSRDFGQTLNVGVTQAQGHPTVLSPDGDYGYLDLPAKRVRVLFLNSSDEGYYGYSLAQLRFLVGALSGLAAGWTALLLQHFCIRTDIGHWTSFPDTKARRQETAIAILEAFVARGSGEAEGLRWDFSALTDQAFAGCFFGDSHFDHHIRENGVAYTISQGYGTIRDQDLIPGAVRTRFERRTQMLVDLVAVKPARRQVRVFRIGAGGEARDRGYGY
ncbi:MAG: twin-arginine translocation signal domain-containing protein [Oligosphaeraceae bacterium]